MDAITDHGMKVKIVAQTDGIPMSSLRDHLYGRVMGRKRGTKTMLSQKEEESYLIIVLRCKILATH